MKEGGKRRKEGGRGRGRPRHNDIVGPPSWSEGGIRERGQRGTDEGRSKRWDGLLFYFDSFPGVLYILDSSFGFYFRGFGLGDF